MIVSRPRAMTKFGGGPSRPFAGLQCHGSYRWQTGPIVDIVEPTRMTKNRKSTIMGNGRIQFICAVQTLKLSGPLRA
jgi:hypothetical protein